MSLKLDRIAAAQTDLEALRFCIMDANCRHEEEVARYKHDIVKTKRQLNDEVPAVALVPELLAEVFKYCQPSPSDARRALRNRKSPYKWIQVTHVCHRWRNVALTHAGLWNEVYATDFNADMVNLVLSRSQQSPIHLYYEGRDEAGAGCLVLRMFFLHIRRARSLEIRRFSDIWKDRLLSYIQAPLLKSLVIANTLRSDASLVYILDNLVYSSLTSVHLHACPFSIDHRMFSPSLQELRLNSNYVSGISLPSFFALLVKLPRLEILEVSYILQEPEDEQIESLQIVKLASVHHFRFGGRLESAIDIMKTLVLPSLTSLVLELHHEDDLDEEWYVSLVNAIAPAFTCINGTKESITTMYLGQHRTEDDMTIRAWKSNPEEARCGLQIPQTPPLVSIRIEDEPLEHLVALVDELPTQDVRQLWLHGPLDLVSQNYSLLRDHFPNVEALSMVGRAATTFPEVSRHTSGLDSEADTDDDADTVHSDASDRDCFTFFPRLSSIQLRGVPFRDDWDKVCDWPNFRDDFMNACAFRRDGGAPIQSVSLVKCTNMNAEDVNDLKRVIPNVVWDEVEEHRKYESGDEYEGEEGEGDDLADDGGADGEGHDGAANFFQFS